MEPLPYFTRTINNFICKINIFSGQALCGTCRDETHRAKMFSQHDVIHMSKKTKELHRKVSKALTNSNVSSHKIVLGSILRVKYMKLSMYYQMMVGLLVIMMTWCLQNPWTRQYLLAVTHWLDSLNSMK